MIAETEDIIANQASKSPKSQFAASLIHDGLSVQHTRRKMCTTTAIQPRQVTWFHLSRLNLPKDKQRCIELTFIQLIALSLKSNKQSA